MLGSVKTGNRSLPPITDRNFLFHPLGSLPAEGPGSVGGRCRSVAKGPGPRMGATRWGNEPRGAQLVKRDPASGSEREVNHPAKG